VARRVNEAAEDVAMSVAKMSSTQQVREDRSTPQAMLPDDAPPSWQSRCINTLLRLLPIKKRLALAAAVQERVRRLALRPASHEPTGLGRGVEVTLKRVAGWPVYHTAPSANPGVGNYVLFQHGGGFINEIVRAHWRFIGYLTRHAGVRCVVPIYPLAPGATAKDVVPVTGELLRKLLEDAGPAKSRWLAIRPAPDWRWRQPNGCGIPDIGSRTGWC
jgi:epsilon-lactone hydrolase